ncbi:unnamed protein product, partial [Musa textilis]
LCCLLLSRVTSSLTMHSCVHFRYSLTCHPTFVAKLQSGEGSLVSIVSTFDWINHSLSNPCRLRRTLLSSRCRLKRTLLSF